MARLAYSPYTVEVNVDWLDVTSSLPTPNERWVYVDQSGHEHRYANGYPTLTVVVDAEHWCDGTEGFELHEPHMVVDESHYECSICDEVIEPQMDPPGTPKSIRGLTSATIEGPRSDGTIVLAALDPDEVEAFKANGQSLAWVQSLVDNIPAERVLSINSSR